MASDLLITSVRLILRPITLQDAESIFRYRSNVVANRYQGWIPLTINDVGEFINQKISDQINIPDTWFQLAIITKDSGKLIGDIGIHFLKSEPDQVELGYTLDKDYQGRGLASEAIVETINFIFKKLSKAKILASVDPRNQKSIKLLESLGFRKQVFSSDETIVRHEYPDDLVYSVHKNEWLKSIRKYS